MPPPARHDYDQIRTYCEGAAVHLAALPPADPLKISDEQRDSAIQALMPLDAVMGLTKRFPFVRGVDPNTDPAWHPVTGATGRAFLAGFRTWVLEIHDKAGKDALRKLWEALIMETVKKSSDEQIVHELTELLSAKDNEIAVFNAKNPLAAITDPANPPKDLIRKIGNYAKSKLKKEKAEKTTSLNLGGFLNLLSIIITLVLVIGFVSQFSAFNHLFSRFFTGSPHQQKMLDDEGYRDQNGRIGGGAGNDKNRPVEVEVPPQQPGVESTIRNALNPEGKK